MWQELEVTSSGSNFWFFYQSRYVYLHHCTVVTETTCVGFNTIFIFQLVHIILLCIDMFLSFIYKAFFPEVPCFLPPNTKASFFIMLFFPLSWFPLSNWVTGYPLWQPWLHFSCYTLTPHASDFSDFCSGVLEVTSSCCAFLNHISGWAKSFLVVIDSSNQNCRDMVQYYPCYSIGTYINSSPCYLITILLRYHIVNLLQRF